MVANIGLPVFRLFGEGLVAKPFRLLLAESDDGFGCHNVIVPRCDILLKVVGDKAEDGSVQLARNIVQLRATVIEHLLPTI